MFYGMCHIATLPVRISPDHKSEMINQLLFGEEFNVIEEKDNWIKIKGGFDNFSGWVDAKGVMEISGKAFLAIKQNSDIHVAGKILTVTRNDGTKMNILPGSSLPMFNPDSLIINIEDTKFLLDESPENSLKSNESQNIVSSARMFLNAPYAWGGRSLFGIDSSGFTQIVYKISHIKILRDVGKQAEEGKKINSLNNALPGDLAFFSNEKSSIIHVGIILENQRIIHASGRVRADKLDEKGIYNTETESYTYFLHSIRRYTDI